MPCVITGPTDSQRTYLVPDAEGVNMHIQGPSALVAEQRARGSCLDSVLSCASEVRQAPLVHGPFSTRAEQARVVWQPRHAAHPGSMASVAVAAFRHGLCTALRLSAPSGMASWQCCMQPLHASSAAQACPLVQAACRVQTAHSMPLACPHDTSWRHNLALAGSGRL